MRGRERGCVRYQKHAPHGRVSGVQDEREGRGHAKHPEHGLMGRILVFEMEGTHRAPKHAPTGCVWVFETREGKGTCSRRKGREGMRQAPEHGLMGHVLVFETEGTHWTPKTRPGGACFGAQDEGIGSVMGSPGVFQGNPHPQVRVSRVQVTGLVKTHRFESWVLLNESIENNLQRMRLSTMY